MDFFNLFYSLAQFPSSQVLTVGLILFFAFSTAYYLYENDFYDLKVRYFLGLCSLLILLMGFSLIANFLPEENTFVYFFNVGALALTSFYAPALVSFASRFVEETSKITTSLRFFALKVFLYGGATLLAAFILFDGLYANGTIIANIEPEASNFFGITTEMYKEVIWAFSFFGLFLALFFLGLAGRKQGEPASEARWVLFFTGASAAFFLAHFFALFPFALVAGFTLFLFGIAYSLTKYRPFYKKVFFTGRAVFLFLFFVYVQILFDASYISALYDFGVFLLTVALGVAFMKSIRKEVEQNFELATLAEKQKNFNTNLEMQVTEQTREVREQKAHTDAVINNLSIGLIEHTEDLEIIRMNEASEELLGLEPKEVKGLKLEDNFFLAKEDHFGNLFKVFFSSESDEAETIQEMRSYGRENVFLETKEIFLEKPWPQVIEVTTVPIENPLRQEKQYYLKILHVLARKPGGDSSRK